MKKSFLKRFNPAVVVAYGTLLAAIGVALGAFGAHALKSTLSPELLSTFDTGVRYQMYHAFALVIAGLGGKFWAPVTPRNFVMGSWCFALGTILFSGSLYVLSLSGPSWIAYVTPVGGLLFIAGWIFLFVAILKECRTTS